MPWRWWGGEDGRTRVKGRVDLMRRVRLKEVMGEQKPSAGWTVDALKTRSYCCFLLAHSFTHPPSSSNQSSKPLWSLWVNRWQGWGVDWTPPHAEKEKLGGKLMTWQNCKILGNTKHSYCVTLGLYNLRKPNVVIWKTKKRKVQMQKSEARR